MNTILGSTMKDIANTLMIDKGYWLNMGINHPLYNCDFAEELQGQAGFVLAKYKRAVDMGQLVRTYSFTRPGWLGYFILQVKIDA